MTDQKTSRIDWDQQQEVVRKLQSASKASYRLWRSYQVNHTKKGNRIRTLHKFRNEFARAADSAIRRMDAELTRLSKMKEVADD